jgi:Uma2 family endonuclease
MARFKRPDLSIFCTEPPDSDEALEVLPVAVVEILSPGYEDKDLGPDGAPFYLAHGVVDVVVVDPRTGVVFHFSARPLAGDASGARDVESDLWV